MAENKLLDSDGLVKVLQELKKKFPLISSLATINGHSLVNSGYDIEILGQNNVCFFDGFETISSSSITAGSASGNCKIVFNTTTSTFIAAVYRSGVIKPDCFNNWVGGDDFGESSMSGKMPDSSKLYIDKTNRMFYHWNGSAMVSLTLDTTLFRVVSALPTASADTENKIYLKTGSKTGTENAYAEYITVPDGNGYKWEKLGEFNAGIDLSLYVSKTEMNNALRNYLTTSVASATYLKQSDAKSTYMSITDYGYSTITESDITTAFSQAGIS